MLIILDRDKADVNSVRKNYLVRLNTHFFIFRMFKMKIIFEVTAVILALANLMIRCLLEEIVTSLWSMIAGTVRKIFSTALLYDATLLP